MNLTTSSSCALLIGLKDLPLLIDLLHAALIRPRHALELSTPARLDDQKVGHAALTIQALQAHTSHDLCQFRLATRAQGLITNVPVCGSGHGVAVAHALSVLVRLRGSAVVFSADLIPLASDHFAYSTR